MQSWVSNNFPWQARPPPLGAGSVQLRVRTWTPSPHDLLQLPQLDQVLKFPSTKRKQNVTCLGDQTCNSLCNHIAHGWGLELQRMIRESVQTRLLKLAAGRAIQYLSVNNLCLSIITAFSFLCCCLYLKKALHFLFYCCSKLQRYTPYPAWDALRVTFCKSRELADWSEKSISSCLFPIGESLLKITFKLSTDFFIFSDIEPKPKWPPKALVPAKHCVFPTCARGTIEARRK